ncbi:c-type cytochrome [Litoreibacter sp.]|nr:c-type cytochrome [Litoreibacter sp.]
MIRALCIALGLAAPATAQEFFTLKGHGGPIMDIAVSASGQIATASFDNSVGLWSGRTPDWVDGHEAAVNAVGFWSDDIVASAGDDFALRLWSRTMNTSRLVAKHQGKITDIAIGPDGQTVATASWDGAIGLWLVIGDENRPLEDWGVIGKWLKGHKAGVNAVVFSDDGKTLYSASADGTIRAWSYAASDVTSQILVKHGFGVNELILNEQDGWLAYGAVDGGTRLIDPDTGAEIADFTLDRRPILSMAYDPKQSQLAVGDGEGYIMVIDTNARKITRDFRATQRGPIWALAFSPDGQNIHAGGIEDIMYSWPIATMTEHGPMAGTTRSFLEDPDKMSNGERQFKRKCSICHALTEGSARKAGPSLHHLFGRRAGVVTDYIYSDILTGSEIVWSAETINALFDEGPDHYIPGTKMPMQRIAKSQDRNDLIAYLRQATATEGKTE